MPPVLRKVEPEPDILVSYLPGILRQDPFLVNLLRVFDTVLRPLLERIDSIDTYLDAGLTTPSLVRWLGSWVGASLEASWPEAARRALVREAVILHRQRGTAAGLRRALTLIAGMEPLIIENTAGLRLDVDARLGVNTSLSETESRIIYVTFDAPASSVDLDAIHEIIRQMKPAHAVYQVRTREA